jgi:small subunit ribosomal protein S18
MPKPMNPKNSKKKGGAPEKKFKKKTSILTAENITWVDYKDVNLLRRFMSERAKIRARRVNGNDQQQQAAIAKAIKLAREMALLPYSVRQVQQRSKGKGRGDRREREGDLADHNVPQAVPYEARGDDEGDVLAEEFVASDGAADDGAVNDAEVVEVAVGGED